MSRANGGVERVGRLGLGRHAGDDRLGGARRVGQQRRPLGGARPEHGRLEQLAHDPERERALELGAARSQHAQAERVGHLPRVAQQPRLADARDALDQDEAPGADPGVLEHGAQIRALCVALQQALDRPVVHRASLCGAQAACSR